MLSIIQELFQVAADNQQNLLGIAQSGMSDAAQVAAVVEEEKRYLAEKAEINKRNEQKAKTLKEAEDALQRAKDDILGL